METTKRLTCGVVCVALLALARPAAAQNLEVHVDYYTPEYYLDYPVFYDETGRPFYYEGGVVQYIPSTYAHYHALRRHYRLHRHDYHRWYRARGHRFHRYRRAMRAAGYAPVYHDGYLVFYDPSGLPFYYHGSRRIFIPASHPRHRYYRTHYRTHRGRYHTWYRRHGRSYHGYRRHGYRRAAPPSRRHDPPRRVRAGYGGHPARGRPAGRYGAPARHPAHGRVDCSRNPGHPACRRGRGGHGGGQRYHQGHRGRGRAAPPASHGRRRHRRDR